MHPFQAFIKRYTHLSEEDWAQIEPYIEKSSIKKGDCLIQEGEFCTHLYFLEEGLLKFYTGTGESKTTKFFTTAPYAITSQKSFIEDKPCEEGIVAEEDCVIWKIDRRRTFQLLKMDSWNNFMRKLILEVKTYNDNILDGFDKKSGINAQEKDKDILLKQNPLKQLSSYFGFTSLNKWELQGVTPNNN